MFNNIIKRLKFKIVKYYLKGVDVTVIVSTGRTGTQFFEGFYNFIDANSKVYHEPSPDLFKLGLNKIRGNWIEERIINYIIENRGRLLFSFKGFIQRLLCKKINYIESNPFLYPLLKEFTIVFKSFKVIYLTRDPNTYLISAFNKDPRSDGNNNFYGINDLRKRLNATDFSEMNYEEWNELSRIEKIAWHWNSCNKILYDYFYCHKENSIMIKFEDLFSSNDKHKREVIKKIIKFTHPDFEFYKNKNDLYDLLLNKVNKSKKLSKMQSIKDFDLNLRKKIDGIVEPMSKKLDYK